MKKLLSTLVILTALPVFAQCPNLMDDCDLPLDVLASGRFELFREGTVTFRGIEEGVRRYQVQGTLTLTREGNAEGNFIDIHCDGTVTGKGRDKIVGEIVVARLDPPACDYTQRERYPVTFRREFDITGTVVQSGDTPKLALFYTMSGGQATAHYHYMDLFDHPDEGCVVREGALSCGPVTGDIGTGTGRLANMNILDEVVIENLAGVGGGTFEITGDEASEILGCQGGKQSWTFHAGTKMFAFCDPEADDVMVPPVSCQIPGTAEADHEVNVTLKRLSASITDAELNDPVAHLVDVSAMTKLLVTVDWSNVPEPHQVLFEYGANTVTVAADSDQVEFPFDAGEEADIIRITPLDGSGGPPGPAKIFQLAKVEIPSWADDPGNWVAEVPGVAYSGELNWPIALEATRTLDTIRLVSGFWGVEGVLSSELQMRANSDLSPGTGDFLFEAGFKAAGQNGSLRASGQTSTQLGCDSLDMNGFGSTTIPIYTWRRSMNPLQTIPGVERILCGNHIFKKATCGLAQNLGLYGKVGISGTGTVEFGNRGQLVDFTGGLVGASIDARVGIAFVPKPLDKIISFQVEGGGKGCMEIRFAPELAIERLGGEIEVSMNASFIGFSTSKEKVWPFGDSCAGLRPSPIRGKSLSGLPADAQLTLALGPEGSAAAAWSALPAGGARPAGDIHLAFNDGTGWGAPIILTDDLFYDGGPELAFAADGSLMVVWQRNPYAAPGPDESDIAALAGGMEMVWARIEAGTGIVLDEGALTADASFDLGSVLCRDAAGGLHLFWQKVGQDLAGTASDPAGIWMTSWSETGWSAAEEIAPGLKDIIGWNAAVHDADRAQLALVVDGDSDFATEPDRELFRAVRNGGAWPSPSRWTDNAVTDDGPLPTYDAEGNALIAWRQDDDLWVAKNGIASNLLAEVGPGLGHGFFQSQGDVQLIAWSSANDVLSLRCVEGTWDEQATHLETSDDQEHLYDLHLTGPDTVRTAVVRRPFTPDLRALAGDGDWQIGSRGFGGEAGRIELGAFAAPSTEMEILVLGQQGVNYMLQASPNLVTPVWSELGEAVLGLDGRSRLMINAPENRQFFRLRREP